MFTRSQAYRQSRIPELDITTYGGTRFVQCKDGNIYTVETTKDGKNNLVRINADFSLKKVAMRDDYSPSSFGAYREASFCGTPEGIFYYIAGGKIYKATFDNPAPEETLTEYTKEGYGFYGAGIRVNPKTNELLAMYLTGDYQKKSSGKIQRRHRRKDIRNSIRWLLFPGYIHF